MTLRCFGFISLSLDIWRGKSAESSLSCRDSENKESGEGNWMKTTAYKVQTMFIIVE